jgi:hypothetical protein
MTNFSVVTMRWSLVNTFLVVMAAGLNIGEAGIEKEEAKRRRLVSLSTSHQQKLGGGPDSPEPASGSGGAWWPTAMQLSLKKEEIDQGTMSRR